MKRTRRTELSKSRRIVVKVGSRILRHDSKAPARLAREIASLKQGGASVVLVSSGSIAIGCKRLGYKSRPKEMGRLQAAAAAGQGVLMRRYDEGFADLGITTAQVLLTHADLADRERLNNARLALGTLLDAGAVPIVNENDTVATDEIRFGDNDQLASMVVPLVGADLLILLTDVEGVLDPMGKRIGTMEEDAAIADLPEPTFAMGSGGMRSKIDAARKACRSGAHVVIAPATESEVLPRVVSGEDLGTYFPPTGRALRARKHWIAFTLRPRGTLILDAGASSAVASGKRSLLPIGVLGVRGNFNPGDAVRLLTVEGCEVGRGLTRLGALDVARAAGKKGRDLELLFGVQGADLVVVHKDDLVTI